MKGTENYLDLVPVKHPRNTWTDTGGIVTIHRVNRGLINRLAQMLFGCPGVSRIDLDAFGSFLWRRMDGRRTVGDLAQALKAEFGDRAEPLYARLVVFLQNLRNNDCILFSSKD